MLVIGSVMCCGFHAMPVLPAARHAVGVPRVERPLLEHGPGVGVEVRHQALVERRQLVLRHQLGELEAVGDDHDVVPDGLALGQDRADLLEPGRVVLDDLGVRHRDAGRRGELTQGRVIGVDVERPVGEVPWPCLRWLAQKPADPTSAVGRAPAPGRRGGGLGTASGDGEPSGQSGQPGERERVAAPVARAT